MLTKNIITQFLQNFCKNEWQIILPKTSFDYDQKIKYGFGQVINNVCQANAVTCKHFHNYFIKGKTFTHIKFTHINFAKHQQSHRGFILK